MNYVIQILLWHFCEKIMVTFLTSRSVKFDLTLEILRPMDVLRDARAAPEPSSPYRNPNSNKYVYAEYI